MDASVAIALVFALDSDKPPGKRRKWSKDWFLKRETYGHVNLLQELRVNEPEDFRNFLRMDAPSFDELLGLVEPLIRKEDTVMRPSIPPSERLSITLRYLASGNLTTRQRISNGFDQSKFFFKSFFDIKTSYTRSNFASKF